MLRPGGDSCSFREGPQAEDELAVKGISRRQKPIRIKTSPYGNRVEAP